MYASIARISSELAWTPPQVVVANNAFFSQLSRGKGDSKSSKKNKDSKDGTASPSSSAGRETQSPNLTPSSSTSTLNDPRMKPLPPNNGGSIGGDPAMQSQGSHGSPAGSSGASDRFGSLSSQQSPNGAVTPSRHGTLPPTVVISPSGAPVSLPLHSSN